MTFVGMLVGAFIVGILEGIFSKGKTEEEKKKIYHLGNIAVAILVILFLF